MNTYYYSIKRDIHITRTLIYIQTLSQLINIKSFEFNTEKKSL